MGLDILVAAFLDAFFILLSTVYCWTDYSGAFLVLT